MKINLFAFNVENIFSFQCEVTFDASRFIYSKMVVIFEEM